MELVRLGRVGTKKTQWVNFDKWRETNKVSLETGDDIFKLYNITYSREVGTSIILHGRDTDEYIDNLFMKHFDFKANN